MDNLTKEQRKKSMTAIKSSDTNIELLLRKALWERNIRYRKNFTGLPGKPDIAIAKYHIAIFCDSEFWHGYDWGNSRERIHSNRDYWIPKIEKNMLRDQQVNAALAEMGWTVLRFWGKQIRKDTRSCVNAIIMLIEKQNRQ